MNETIAAPPAPDCFCPPAVPPRWRSWKARRENPWGRKQSSCLKPDGTLTAYTLPESLWREQVPTLFGTALINGRTFAIPGHELVEFNDEGLDLGAAFSGDIAGFRLDGGFLTFLLFKSAGQRSPLPCGGNLCAGPLSGRHLHAGRLPPV